MKAILLLITVLFFVSCKTNQYKIENKTKFRHGKWIEKDSYPNQEFLSKGKYKNNAKTGAWKTFINGKLHQKDRYRDSIITTKIYYPNGKMESQGRSKLLKKGSEIHWFYYGNWKFYKEDGTFSHSKLYEKDSLKTKNIETASNTIN